MAARSLNERWSLGPCGAGLHGPGRRSARAPQYEVPPNGGPGPRYRGTHDEWRCLPCRCSMAQRPRPPPFRVVRRAVVPKRLSSFDPTTGSQNWLQSCLDTRCRGEHRPRTDSPSFFDCCNESQLQWHQVLVLRAAPSAAAGLGRRPARTPALFSRSSRFNFSGARRGSVTDNRRQWLSRRSPTPRSPRWTTSSARRRRR